MKVRRTARWAIPIVAVLAITAAACTPPKPQPPAPGRNVAYYLWRDGSAPGSTPATSFYRAAMPGSHPSADGTGSFHQGLAGSSIVLQEINVPLVGSAPTNGFVTALFRLGDFTRARLQIAPGSNFTAMGLIFDVNGNGQVLAFDAAGRSTGFGGDEIGTDGFTQNVFVMDDSRVIGLEPNAGGCAGGLTIAQYKAGTCPGINANTMVALYVLVPYAGADALTTVTSLQLNGIELL